MFVGFVVIEIRLFNRKKKKKQKKRMKKHGNSVKILNHMYYTCFIITRFFSDIISFQHVLHFGVGRSQIEWKLKVKTDIKQSLYRKYRSF